MSEKELLMLVPELRGKEIIPAGVKEARPVFPKGLLLVGVRGQERRVLEHVPGTYVMGAPENYEAMGYDTLVAISGDQALVYKFD